MALVRIYKIYSAYGFQWVRPTGSTTYGDFEFNGTERGAGWRQKQVEFVRSSEGLRLEPADIYSLVGDPLILAPVAVGAIGDRLAKWGELLPLACDDEEIVAFAEAAAGVRDR